MHVYPHLVPNNCEANVFSLTQVKRKCVMSSNGVLQKGHSGDVLWGASTLCKCDRRNGDLFVLGAVLKLVTMYLCLCYLVNYYFWYSGL